MSDKPILKDYEWFKACGIQYYDFSEEDIDKLVDMYFNDQTTKRKGIHGYFKWLGIDMYGNTHRGSFEYEGEYLNYIQSTINKCRKKYKVNRVYNNANIFDDNLFKNP